MAKWNFDTDGNGGFNVGKALFWLLLTLVAGVSFTTGDFGDFLDGPSKVRRVERIEVELGNLTKRFEKHVESNIDERRMAAEAVETRFGEISKRMAAQTKRLDDIYNILTRDKSGSGDR